MYRLPVSYTHLDVYKRQTLTRAEFDKITDDLVQATVEPIDPVSYTHLDVYKRQYLPGRCGRFSIGVYFAALNFRK